MPFHHMKTAGEFWAQRLDEPAFTELCVASKEGLTRDPSMGKNFRGLHFDPFSIIGADPGDRVILDDD